MDMDTHPHKYKGPTIGIINIVIVIVKPCLSFLSSTSILITMTMTMAMTSFLSLEKKNE